ncbi:hypothetical protein RQP46_007184 [Phenoliferia psychrophenolica]
MNVVQEIHRINARELASGSSASWHDQYKDSAYIYVGGLPYQLTEGDVIAICSQYGEVVDVSLPRDPATQKPKGFAFVMYADQRSTVLAVDNLGGSKVLERTLKVDHVLNYKQLERDNDSGKMKERDEQKLSAHPDNFRAALPGTADGSDGGSDSDSSHPSIDLDDPMRDYLIRQKRETRAAKGGSSKKRGREGESKEERRARRETKKRAKADKALLKERKSKGAITDRPRGERDSRDHGRERERERDDRGARDAPRRSESNRDRDDGGRDSSRRRDEDDGYRRRDRDDRDDRDRPRKEGGGLSAFADLEKWAKGGGS